MQKHVQPGDEAKADANDSCAHLREQVALKKSPVTLQRLIGNSLLSETADLALKKVLKTKTDPKLALFFVDSTQYRWYVLTALWWARGLFCFVFVCLCEREKKREQQNSRRKKQLWMNVSCWCIVKASWFVHAAETNVVNAYVCRVCIRSYPHQQITHQRKWTLGLTEFHLTINFNHTYAYPHTLALYTMVKKREMTFKLNTEHFSKRAGRTGWQKHEMGRDGAVCMYVNNWHDQDIWPKVSELFVAPTSSTQV